MNTKSKYNEDLKRIELESLRDSFEKKIYEITDRLLMSEERWKDVNHLLISTQKNSNNEYSSNKKVYLSKFLEAAGIDKTDLTVDPKLVFILTPFNNKHQDIYNTISKVCNSVGLKCQRGDEDFIHSDILSHILKQIVKASFVIANVNGRNPNVYYELGIAHALDKPTIIIAKSPNNLTFDIKAKRVIFYENASKQKFQEDLRSEIMKIWVNDFR